MKSNWFSKFVFNCLKITKPKWDFYDGIDDDEWEEEARPMFLAKLSRGFIRSRRGVFIGAIAPWDEGLLKGEEPSGVLAWKWEINLYGINRGEELYRSEKYFYSPEWAKRDLELFWKNVN